MIDTLKTGKATPVADNEPDADIKSKISTTNPQLATKTNEDILSGLEKFAPQQISDSGKSIYSAEYRHKILNQLKALLSKGHNLTMTKKALSVYHNINTGTLDKWRKEEDFTTSPSPNEQPQSDIDRELIEQNLDEIETNLNHIMSQVQQTREMIRRKTRT